MSNYVDGWDAKNVQLIDSGALVGPVTLAGGLFQVRRGNKTTKKVHVS